jgi:large subunit ribosomal protein L13Ae
MFLIQPQRLSHEVGWGYKDVVDRLEEKRKIRAKAFHERKVIAQIMLWSMFVLNFFQLATIKLRQKAITDHSASFGRLTALGY